ncbi:hypothetical protein B0H66DRAFT_617882 [Apodospora peruviana]|uniref:Cytochrome P450 n=1 Tax=Apodospora peruviana TaxID=516989 RepID=A0AAE0IK85_9PEZI|nr:hypothetical protein B0H66DRAFT_617882 [Apodospora peruviana]
MATLSIFLRGIIMLLASWTLYLGVCLLRNYMVARKIGVPIRIIPIDRLNPIWMLIDRKVLSVLKWLVPWVDGTGFARYNFRGWELKDRIRSHQELGDAFVLVTPGMVLSCRPRCADGGLSSKKQFPALHRAHWNSQCLGTQHLDGRRCTMEDATQADSDMLHRANNKIVWSESTVISKAMLHNWTSEPSVKTIAPDTRSLSLNVLSTAGFGKSAATYFDDAKARRGGLAEQEIYANMFVLNLAGHDTTAHTFTFALYFLAAHPAVTDWISEELRRVLGDHPPGEWHYKSNFPRLKRCLAVNPVRDDPSLQSCAPGQVNAFPAPDSPRRPWHGQQEPTALQL